MKHRCVVGLWRNKREWHSKGQRFDPSHLRQMDIGRTSTFSKAVLPLKFDSDVKAEKEGQGF